VVATSERSEDGSGRARDPQSERQLSRAERLLTGAVKSAGNTTKAATELARAAGNGIAGAHGCSKARGVGPNPNADKGARVATHHAGGSGS
jgi:hypothetical protein